MLRRTMRALILFVLVSLSSAGLAIAGSAREEPVWIDAGLHHLGDDSVPEWTEASVEPEGGRLEVSFESSALPGEATLALVQRDVHDEWRVLVNGRHVATLERREERLERYFALPAGVLRDGVNRLVVESDRGTDDILVGELRLWRRPFREVLDLGVVTVRVRDAATDQPMPGRIALTDAGGEAAPVFYAARLHTAVREGLVYTSDGDARFEVPRGEYRMHVSRGMEWSLHRSDVVVTAAPTEVVVPLRREVATDGFVAADTHVHTLTHSGHGDSSVEERLVTLAGEGVELAVATDHNHNTDYEPLQQQMALEAFFTPVVGNEVTTPVGHFNAFPLDPAAEIPPHDLHDFAAIVAGCRERGALAVILNHPRWPDHETGPYGVGGLDHHTGATLAHPLVHDYDAVEIINSDTEEPRPMQLFHDWFALLNRGERVVGVASSDSHAVGVVVGQGRTYVRSSRDDPRELDVEECARNIATGRSSIAMGIFADLRLGGRSVMGETLHRRRLDDGESFALRIAAPSWVRPERLQVFWNGLELHSRPIESTEGRATDLSVEVPALPRGRDGWLVCVVRGADAGGPHWPQRNAYTLGATNPLFVDGDGDGICLSPRQTAQRLLDEAGRDVETIRRLLPDLETPAAIHLLDLARAEWMAAADDAARKLGAEVEADHHPSLGAWLRSLDADR